MKPLKSQSTTSNRQLELVKEPRINAFVFVLKERDRELSKIREVESWSSIPPFSMSSAGRIVKYKVDEF